MKIKRLTISLPAHLKDTAQHDARAIAQAVGAALSVQKPGSNVRVELPGHGQSGAALATQVASQLTSGGRNGR